MVEHALTKVCNVSCDDWDERILAVLLAYCTTRKCLTRHTPFCLVYGKALVMPMKYIVPSMHIALLMYMSEEGVLHNRLDELMQLEEDRFLDRFHQ